MKLTIPTPCSENWDAMTPTACGRFCKVCQKEVIDVSEMEDDAILQKYEDNRGNLCIRARTEQISPVMMVRTFPMQRLAVFALAVWLVFAGGLVSEAVGQTDSVITDSVAKTAVLKGKITMNGEPASYAIILLKKENMVMRGCLTNEDGEFRLDNIKTGKYFVKVLYLDDTVQQSVDLQLGDIKEVSIMIHSKAKVTMGIVILDHPKLIDKSASPRRTTFDLQDIRRIPNNR